MPAMPANDALLRAINEPETIRVVAAITTEAAREACRRQQARGIAAVAIARALTVGAMLATLGKGERERVRIQLQGGGPVGHERLQRLPVNPGEVIPDRLDGEPFPVHLFGDGPGERF